MAGFVIPASLPDLEREPYNLFPYPNDFQDDDEAIRAESFAELVRFVERGNRTLNSASFNLFDDDDDEDPWLEKARVQALYTLVRKSTSLAPPTRLALAQTLSKAVTCLCTILEAEKGETTAPQGFRDALACHFYMLYSFMFFLESEAKGSKADATVFQIREICATAMLKAAATMADCRTTLWKQGVPEESVILLPCRIAYPMLEAATGVAARKTACGDEAVQMIAISVHNENLLTSTTAALMDLMHNFEHMAVIVAEICDKVADDRLAVEIIREIGRLESEVGVKNVAPFLVFFAESRPKLMLQNLSHVLDLLNHDPYSMRSAIVSAISHILVYLGKPQEEQDNTTLDVTKSRASLLDLLTERVYDVSSFTRASVLKAWIRLTTTQSIPKDRIVSVATLAMDRLQDKTVLVRKQAMQLLTLLLENNPYMKSLAPQPYQNKLAELYDYVKTHMPEEIVEAAKQQQVDDDEGAREMKQAALAAAIEQADGWMKEEDLTDVQQEFCSKVQALKFTQSALDFIDVFEDATTALEGMLLSANTSDVTEALRFFVQARHFQLPCAVTGMKRALALMWSSETAIRDEVLKAFVDVFIAGLDGQLLPNEEIAKNLMVLAGQASISELASIEEAIVRLVKEERLPDDIFLILWSVASKGNLEARATALQLLSMGAGADRSIVDSKSRLKLLLDAGLGEENRSWKLYRASAVCLQRIARAQVDPTDAKYLVLERIIDELCSICCGDGCQDENADDTLQWFSVSEQAIKALFVIAPEPEVACKRIITAMCNTTLREDMTSVHALRLARFFHILGHIALNLLVYTEALTSSVRRANAKQSQKKQEEADKSKTTSGDEDAIEAELGVAAETEAENERRLADIAENEIVGRNLISMFGPLLVRVVGNEGGKYNSEILLQASTLALCKLMCVSSSFCEKHLPLLFTVLANAPQDDITMRSNTVVALGDLAFRFPNEVEPYTPRLYACLRDPSTKVRRHTLMVLTHLILNDMIKVKGQVCEIAMCLRDDDSRIRDMSRLLFHELSKRSNNPIYNLLPEIVSQLSQKSLPKEDFRGIMSFLLGYIKKERQNEMLTEKLCQRFPKCSSLAQSADLAYCIALLKLSEKSIKCLSDSFSLYKDALLDDDVNKSFASIVTKAKKFTKPERRQLVDEWEAKLGEFAAAGADDHQASQKAAKAKKKATRRAARKKHRVLEATEEEEEEENDELEFTGDEDADVDSADKENAQVSRARSRRSRTAA